MKRQRSTKIVATLGPATSSPEAIRALWQAGADVFRLNFSHGTHADHLARIEACGADFADTVVVTGGVIADRKGVNVPDVVLPLSPLTDKDRRDLAFALEHGVDWVALSFVQRGEDVAEARQLVDGRARLLSKLEKPSAVEALEEIVALSDAVMLSAESASGRYPVEAVAMMDRIIARVEADPYYRQALHAEAAVPAPTDADAIGAAVCRVTGILPVTAIVAYTTSGFTSLRIARERQEAPILSLTPNAVTARSLVLARGVHSAHTCDAESVEDIIAKAGRIAAREGFATAGQPRVVIAGMPFGTPGATNLLRIVRA